MITKKISEHTEKALIEQSHQSCVLEAITLDGSSMLGKNTCIKRARNNLIGIKNNRSNHVGSSLLGTVT